MDPHTVILMLAIQLIASGGLMALVWRRMPGAAGLGRWALASTLFGVAYVVRLAAGLHGVDALGLASDGGMLLAVLLFIGGAREFVGRRPLRHAPMALLWLALFGIELAAVALAGAQGRHVALNVTIGALYAQVTWTLATHLKHQGRPLHAPLRLLAGIVGTLAVLTLLRAEDIASHGMAVAFRGPMAQVYYFYATVSAVVTALTLVWMMLLRLNGQLAELATRDALTGLYNRNGLAKALKQHFDQRDAAPLTLLLVDIDHFKRINDTRGHATGDAVLRAVSAELLAQLRAGDFVARIGGEEFLVGCVGADAATALALAARLHRGIGRLEVAAARGGARVGCTVSIGVSASFRCFDEWESAASQADEALYRAKATGRDGVQAHLVPLAH